MEEIMKGMNDLKKFYMQSQQQLSTSLMSTIMPFAQQEKEKKNKENSFDVSTSEVVKSLHEEFEKQVDSKHECGINMGNSNDWENGTPVVIDQPIGEPKKSKNQLRREQRCFTCQGVWTLSHACGSHKEDEAMFTVSLQQDDCNNRTNLRLGRFNCQLPSAEM